MSIEDIATLNDIFEDIGNKNKLRSQTAIDRLKNLQNLQNLQNLIIFLVTKLEIDNKPNVITSACNFVSNIISSQSIDDTHLQQYYYLIIPSVTRLCLELKPAIRDSARSCLEVIYNSVKNKDIELLIPELLNTIYNPENVDTTIDKLASTKFVTTVTAGTISILCPLLVRGYNRRKDNISRLCSKIIVNMLKLVDKYEDVENFIKILAPLLKNAVDIISDPEARNTVSISLVELDKIESSKSIGISVKSSILTNHVELCNCNFTLAYGNKVLLKNTNMTLYKGCKYGLIGESGKSTLLSAISENKLDGFPDTSEVRCVFVQTDIIGQKSHLNCLEYILDDPKIHELILNLQLTNDFIIEQLISFGFGNSISNLNSPAKIEDSVSTLSGGWRMKLALTRAMLMRPDILLLESPTDHLDIFNIDFVKNYIKTSQISIIFTSQSKDLLNHCCTHIMKIRDLKLNIYDGNLDNLIKIDPSTDEYFNKIKSSNEPGFTFPQPGVLDGVKSRTKAILKMDNCSFTYPNNSKPTVEDITIQISLESRVGIAGANGAGKSTQIKLLTGENIPQIGTVYKHPSVRLGYIAQHSFETVDSHPNKTPNEYIRWRFEIPGEDREAIKKQSTTLNPGEIKEMCNTYTFTIKDENDKPFKIAGIVDSLTGLRRKEKDGTFSYQIKFSGKSDDSNIYIPMLELLKRNEVCFQKLINAVDDKIASMAGLYIKPLTRKNVEDHLSFIGLEPELASHTKISQLSDGEKVKCVIAACMWMNPHILVFDEPTNSMSWDSLVALVGAIKQFEGGVVIISHNQDFVDSICNEIWLMTKDPNTGIGHLKISNDNTKNLKELMTKSKEIIIEPQNYYIDSTGNEIKIINKKKATKCDLKKIKKKIALMRKSNIECWTDEELEKNGLFLS